MLIAALSGIARTNQIKITDSPQVTADKLFNYLFSLGRGIESFSLDEVDLRINWELIEEEEDEDEADDEESEKKKRTKDEAKAEMFRQQHRRIKEEIQKRLAAQGEAWPYEEIQYISSFSAKDRKQIFFLSPNANHSGWTDYFEHGGSDRERLFNLIFKLYLLSEELPVGTLNGFEELLLIHTSYLTKPKPNTKRALIVWGQNVRVRYNYHHTLTLDLIRKCRRFYPAKDRYRTVASADLGEIILHKDKKYYFSRALDARRSNPIKFMRFEKDDHEFTHFKKTQVFLYQFLMEKLAAFLDTCGILYKVESFQATHYLENNFMKTVEPTTTLEIINNTGADLTPDEQKILGNVLRQQSITKLSFFAGGRTISTFEPVPLLKEQEKPRWVITEVVPWASIKLTTGQNYLVLNKILNPETESSMAVLQPDGIWRSTTKVGSAATVDFYSQLKRSVRFMQTGVFISVQGLNVSEFKLVAPKESSLRSILEYPVKIKEYDTFVRETQPFASGQFLETEGLTLAYLKGQSDPEQLGRFYHKYKIDFSPEFEKVLIELEIKNWIRKSLLGEEISAPIQKQPFAKKSFFAIFIRKRLRQDAQGVAVEYLYEDGRIYIKSVMRNVDDIVNRFPGVLRYRLRAPEELLNQNYFADEEEQVFINVFTSDDYTPTLIGCPELMQKLRDGTLEINRQRSNGLFPLVMYYNKEITRVKDLICLDLNQPSYIQSYVPPVVSLRDVVQHGFRVYHLTGKPYPNPDKITLPAKTVFDHPITQLHFSTLTQNILKISENSQTSLLQKVARVLIEN